VRAPPVGAVLDGREVMSLQIEKRLSWGVIAVLSLGVAAYAAAIAASPESGPPFVAARVAETPAMWLHIAASAWALAAGPWQFSLRLRQRALGLHRWLGRSYVAAVVVGGVSAIALAPGAQTGVVAGAGFGLLGVLWVAFTIVALVKIRAGDVTSHRRWMTRSFALTLAAVTLRVYLPSAFAAGVPFTTSYPVIAWLCWVPNLIVAELLLRSRVRAVTREAAA
jgi:uncharacterized membrane protein